MKELIKKKLNKNFPSEKTEIKEFFGEGDKWSELESDIRKAMIPIIEKHKNNFGMDSYGVIDAIHQVLDQMFQKVR